MSLIRQGTLNELLGETEAYFVRKVQERNEQDYQSEKMVSELDSVDNLYGHSETVKIFEPTFVIVHKKKQLDKYVIWIWIPVLNINSHSGSSKQSLLFVIPAHLFSLCPFFKYLI